MVQSFRVYWFIKYKRSWWNYATYIVNWRINKLPLLNIRYSGAKNIPLFSQWPFHFRVCFIVLWHPFLFFDTNTINCRVLQNVLGVNYYYSITSTLHLCYLVQSLRVPTLLLSLMVKNWDSRVSINVITESNKCSLFSILRIVKVHLQDLKALTLVRPMRANLVKDSLLYYTSTTD